MRYSTKTCLYVLTLGLLMLIVTGCGDDPVSGDEPESPPEHPQFSQVSINDSFFRDNPVPDPNDQNYLVYSIAHEGIIEMAVEVESLLNFPLSVLEETAASEAVLDGDTWSWEFTFFIEAEHINQEEGFNAQSKVTAITQNMTGNTVWEIFFTAEDTPIGDLDQFMAFSISVNEDETDGTISFFDPRDLAGGSISWTVPSATVKEIIFDVTEEEGEELNPLQINYNEDQPQFSILVTDDTDDTPVQISWNTDTGTGSIDSPDGTFCWDETLRNTEC